MIQTLLFFFFGCLLTPFCYGITTPPLSGMSRKEVHFKPKLHEVQVTLHGLMEHIHWFAKSLQAVNLFRKFTLMCTECSSKTKDLMVNLTSFFTQPSLYNVYIYIMCLLLHCWWCIKCPLSFVSSFSNFNAYLKREVVDASFLEGKTNPVILEFPECCCEIFKALLGDITPHSLLVIWTCSQHHSRV